MRSRLSWILLLALGLQAANNQPFREALPGYHYEFPRDHFNHPDFKTEWWYYTGNLRASNGHRFGFELTFFRQGLNRSAKPNVADVWNLNDAWLAHLALSDIDGKQFLHAERLNRSGAGLAGADVNQSRVWNGNWQARWTGVDSQRLQAVTEHFSFDLSTKSMKLPVIHGLNGVSQKAEGAGKASHYISLTRLLTKGTITLDGRPFAVEGTAWMDHEFFTHQLETTHAGWDWLSLQLDDNSELMLFRLRRKDGSVDPYSAATYIDAKGNARHLSVNDFRLTPGSSTWTSPQTGGRYPLDWSIAIASMGLDVQVSTPLQQQEITNKSKHSPDYWEGAIDIQGTKSNRAVHGVGYLEMTGYAPRGSGQFF